MMMTVTIKKTSTNHKNSTILTSNINDRDRINHFLLMIEITTKITVHNTSDDDINQSTTTHNNSDNNNNNTNL